MTVINHMAALLMEASKIQMPTIKISKDQYEQWDREFLFDGLRDIRYGQSFCNHFGITDNILYYEGRNDRALAYIRKKYVK